MSEFVIRLTVCSLTRRGARQSGKDVPEVFPAWLVHFLRAGLVARHLLRPLEAQSSVVLYAGQVVALLEWGALPTCCALKPPYVARFL